MARLQVLVATTHQKDLSVVEKMNIRCDAVVANQMRKCSTAPNKINTLSDIRRKNIVEFSPDIVPHVYARGKSPSFLYHRFLSRNARGDRHRPLRLQFGG